MTRVPCVSLSYSFFSFFFFFNDTATTEIYTLSLHDALPISTPGWTRRWTRSARRASRHTWRSEEHTSELQSRSDLVCRLLLEKKNKTKHRWKNNVKEAHIEHQIASITLS